MRLLRLCVVWPMFWSGPIAIALLMTWGTVNWWWGICTVPSGLALLLDERLSRPARSSWADLEDRYGEPEPPSREELRIGWLRDDYLEGRIELEEFERRTEQILSRVDSEAESLGASLCRAWQDTESRS